ncbi:hypothetical protein AURDEDRAFT_152566 [Auricularia subglabra TFB-10046 SS5]|nr:hypothetical protein AURDEDRAFT_152566 [Auricularia subglabra TFB-10046 SS5]
MDASEPGSSAPRGRGRGRGNRGGLGKYLRARGKRGPGLRADFRKMDPGAADEEEEVDSEEERAERAKYSRRALTTNEDRYKEPEPDPHLEAEEPEPEVDLSTLTAKQLALAEREPVVQSSRDQDDDSDVDTSILAKARSSARKPPADEANSRKGKTVVIEWDASLDQMARDKAEAEALSDLKARLKKQAAAPKPPKPSRPGKKNEFVMPPPLAPNLEAKKDKDGLQDFLDDLLA